MAKRLKPLLICLLLSALMACTQALQLPSGQPTAATNIDIDDEEEGIELAPPEPLANPAEDPLENPFAEEAPSEERTEAVTRSVESRRISAPRETRVTIAESDGTTTAPSIHEAVQCMETTTIISWPNASRPESIPDSGFDHPAYCRDNALVPASSLFSDDFARQAQKRRYNGRYHEDVLTEGLGLAPGYYLFLKVADCDALHLLLLERQNALFLRMDTDDYRFKNARELQQYICDPILDFHGDVYVPYVIKNPLPYYIP